MNITEIKFCETEKWNNIVKTFDNYDVYYLNEYVKAFKINGDGEPILIYFENNTTKAINVVMKRDIAKSIHFKDIIKENMYFDLTTPYGYGGFLVDGDDIENLSKVYSEFCYHNNYICEFVRFHPLLKNWQGLQVLYTIIYKGNTVCIDTSSQKRIYSDITSKNRNMIRKAQKSGIETYWSRDISIIKVFIDMYNQTMDKNNADEYYYFSNEFYLSILNDMKYNSMWFYTKINGEIASIAIFMFCNQNMHYHLSATREKYLQLAPTNLLLYEAALWACENGYKKLHLGGGVGSQPDTLYKFKKAFSKNSDQEFYIGQRVFNEKIYRELVEIRKSEEIVFDENNNAISFFPSYRGKL